MKGSNSQDSNLQDSPRILPTKLEIEVKFLVDSLPDIRQRVLDLGGRLAKERVFERNVRFDTADDALLRRAAMLRLRQDREIVLTFKGMPPDMGSGEVRVREELELRLQDFDTAVTLLNRLGFEQKQVYEKYRETFHLADVEVVLDELPFGEFVELEGGEGAIKSAAGALELDWSERILVNYLALMDSARARYDLPFIDLTFANFERLHISAGEVVALARSIAARSWGLDVEGATSEE